MGNRCALVLLLLFCFSTFYSFGQHPAAKGDVVPNISVPKILNTGASSIALQNTSNKITILDFFGTWCAPCLRALPHLQDISNQYKNDVKIVLVSNETSDQLAKFISARKDFSFPVIVDENNDWNKFFQPPALPYTAIIKNGKVIDITTAAAITSQNVQQWLSRKEDTQHQAASTPAFNSASKMNTNQKSSIPIIQISQDYIYAAKTGNPIESIASNLENIDYQTLVTTLSTDDLKKAFWINIYNGFTQASLKANPDQYKNRNAFFSKKDVEVAGKTFSLDEIEHGILRHSKIKWSLGYINKLFPSKIEKQLRVEKLDYRIHFALNCGAKSCPPIAFYNPAIINTQLDVATKAYLTGEAEYDSTTHVLLLPKLMSWFRGDFGGKKGMMRIVKKLGIVPEDAHPKIKFKDYDWSLTLNNYKTNG